ncbi:MAG: hypothetical protein AAFY47_05345 [Pseudomonadota bacterium]
MLQFPTARFCTLCVLAAITAACSNEPEPQDPVVEQMLGEAPEIDKPQDPALTGVGGTPSPASDQGEPAGAMVSGSNGDEARKPDPKRSKLIKADPR